MKSIEIKTKGRFKETIHESEFSNVWIFKTEIGQQIVVNALKHFDIRPDTLCEIECSLKLREFNRDEIRIRNMKLYLETLEYVKPTYQPGEKIPYEMTKEVEKFYWKMKDRDDLTLEEVNALRFIEKQMQNDWKDYLLEGETK